MVHACANTRVHAVYMFCFKYSAYSIYYVGTLETVCKTYSLLKNGCSNS